HKGLAFETVPTPFSRIKEIEPGRAKSVPILEDETGRVHDSFDIALHLEAEYPEGPPLFGSEAGVAASRFVESWAFGSLHPVILRMIVRDIHDTAAEEDRDYFRTSREARFGKALEEMQEGVPALAATLAKALEPVRRTLASHAWLGGPEPRFVDYIVFGTLMWLTAIHGRLPLEPGDAVASWFERCLDLNGGFARQAPRRAA
ncbi:MAG TPA: glutathione S-transferase C-terminal domain-containing protein, partial [Afifellaceae bacterium]|nr:glutathione S-transferase C-terminal domain-containing protein [Afifellaceae bacterium]